MTDDPQEIRAAGRSAARLAREARSAASALRRADGVQWQSDAAVAFRSRLGDRAREMSRCADDLDELNRLLVRHVNAVEARESTLARTVGDVTEVVRTGASVGIRLSIPGGGAIPVERWLP